MRSAREIVCKESGCNAWCPGPEHQHTTLCAHNVRCDALTAALEARDAEHTDAWTDKDAELASVETALAQVTRERDEARASISRQGEGDVVERVLATPCPDGHADFNLATGKYSGYCSSWLGPRTSTVGGLFCASRLRASTPTPAPTSEVLAAIARWRERATTVREHGAIDDLSAPAVLTVLEDLETVARATPAPLLEGLRELAEDCARLALNAFGPARVEESDWQKAITAIAAHLGSAPRRPVGGPTPGDEP